ncbi:BnaA09g14420D [Brassica napus]|uniref:BnaA09g14420D protein n=1 Tax=Brassica napus TaxID=3708 RepID=A0A078I2Q0_BRANA|nr:BnaA09g14420D [Brassica napus]
MSLQRFVDSIPQNSLVIFFYHTSFVYTLLSFGVERLWKLLIRESEKFQGVEEQFNGFKRDVEMLRCFLEDAEAKKHTSAMVRNTIKEVKEIVLDAEDIVETFLLKEKLGNTSGIMKNVRRLPWVISERRELAFGIEAISKRISKVIRDMQSYGVQQFIKNVEILVGYLVAKDSSHQVVSITGMGGLGKTTLARQIFKHETIKSHFPRLAWVCISQQFTRMYVWQTILRQLRPEYKVLEMTEDELQEKLVSVLETQKALIVIDDIWREGDWDRIKHVFLPQKGWKVLLTSRNEGVGLHADPNCVTFNTKCLTLKKSWTLFQRIAFPMKDTNDFKVDKEMEDMGKQMIKHCGSLPLALKVLGRLLAAKYTLRDWKRIYENIRSHIVNGTSISDINISSVFHVLYLSFEELPVYLKHCFLYLAHFPEDYKIDVGTLSYYWGAEGIQRPMYYDGASIRNVADVYIEELVKRNMVISERDVETSRFETCQLHDIMREVCLHQAEEENFLQIGTSTANSKSLYKSRRVAVHWRNERFFHMENPKLRSLVFISKIKRHIDVGINICFTRLPLMRVLDLSRVKFEGEKLPFSIGKLIHLRYLSLRDAYVNHLPSSMRNLKQLLYLNLCVGLSRVYMSNILKEMRELIYLHFPLAIKNKHGSVSDLQCMTRLSTLSIYIRGKGHSAKTLSSSLSQLRCLEKLVIIDYDKLYSPTNDDEGFVLDCVHLKELFLSIYMPKLPDEQHLSSHLTTILLKKCYLKEDPMPILEKLSQLKEVSLQHQSFCGRRMVCSRSGFPQLQKLKLYGLSELEEWIVEEGSMPVVHTLTIRGCGKLKELPDGLRGYISNYREAGSVERGQIMAKAPFPFFYSLYIRSEYGSGMEGEIVRRRRRLLHNPTQPFSTITDYQVVAIARAALDGFKNEAKKMVVVIVDMERAFVQTRKHHFVRFCFFFSSVSSSGLIILKLIDHCGTFYL